MFKAMLATTLLFLSTNSYGDRIDELKAEGKKAYCIWSLNHYLNGADARYKNLPLLFKFLPKDKADDDANVPAIYLIDADKLSEQEKQHMIVNITKGWMAMDKYLKDHKESSKQLLLIGADLKQCMSERSM